MKKVLFWYFSGDLKEYFLEINAPLRVSNKLIQEKRFVFVVLFTFG